MANDTVQRPTYIDPASASDTPTHIVKEKSSISEIALGAVLGSVAAYFIPKLLDHFVPQESDNVEFEVGDDG